MQKETCSLRYYTIMQTKIMERMGDKKTIIDFAMRYGNWYQN